MQITKKLRNAVFNGLLLDGQSELRAAKCNMNAEAEVWVMYKYEYTTQQSKELGVTVSHLGDYERMTDAQLEVERVYQRKLVSINQHDVVLHDTMYVYNY